MLLKEQFLTNKPKLTKLHKSRFHRETVLHTRLKALRGCKKLESKNKHILDNCFPNIKIDTICPAIHIEIVRILTNFYGIFDNSIKF